MSKIKTMSLQGKEYASVAERIRAFREENPTGKIITSHTVLPDGQFVLTAEVIKDNGASATGQAFGVLKEAKSFEKLESVSVGRALAMLGYLASGEIASSDEMQEFLEYQNNKVQEAIVMLQQATTLDELKEAYKSLGNLMANAEVIKAKDTLKTKLK